MKKSIIIAIDAMGGDNAPDAIIHGVAMAAKLNSDIEFLIFGDVNQVEVLLNKHSNLKDRTQFIHTAAKIESNQRPSHALRNSKGTSMRMAIEAVKNKEADLVVSAGNTGAYMAISRLMLGILPRIDRPAIVSTMPSLQGGSVVLDLGANINCAAEDLMQFAIMGSAYAKALFNKKRITIGILNIGEEEIKGHDEIKLAAELLRKSSLGQDFHGFIEGNDIANGTVDVVVTDGFSGNIALKTAEGTGKLIKGFIQDICRDGVFSWISYFLAKPLLARLKSKLDVRNYNGAMFLGLNGIAIKSHGGTDEKGFANAIKVGVGLRKHDINSLISEYVQNFYDEEDLLCEELENDKNIASQTSQDKEYNKEKD